MLSRRYLTCNCSHTTKHIYSAQACPSLLTPVPSGQILLCPARFCLHGVWTGSLHWCWKDTQRWGIASVPPRHDRNLTWSFLHLITTKITSCTYSPSDVTPRIEPQTSAWQTESPHTWLDYTALQFGTGWCYSCNYISIMEKHSLSQFISRCCIHTAIVEILLLKVLFEFKLHLRKFVFKMLCVYQSPEMKSVDKMNKCSADLCEIPQTILLLTVRL